VAASAWGAERVAVHEISYPVPAIDGPSLSAPVVTSEALPSYLVEPTPVDEPTPAVPQEVPVPVVSAPVYAGPALFTKVKVRDERKIHPCAVPVVVSAPDPCNPRCQVCVEVCVPPCTPAQVSCRRCGEKIIYDFGKYEVELTARRGRVVVDYDS
jgi:hypothetical protein